MPTPILQQVLRQVLSAFDQQDWTIFDSQPCLYETRQHLLHLYAAFPTCTIPSKSNWSKAR
jgi:hypothetical protein